MNWFVNFLSWNNKRHIFKKNPIQEELAKALVLVLRFWCGVAEEEGKPEPRCSLEPFIVEVQRGKNTPVKATKQRSAQIKEF